MPMCTATNKAGRRCSAYAIRGGELCFAHSPELEQERLRARSLGGYSKRAHTHPLASTIPSRVRSLEEVLAVLDYILAELYALDNGIPRARALIALASEYVHALDVSELERRLRALEERALEAR